MKKILKTISLILIIGTSFGQVTINSFAKVTPLTNSSRFSGAAYDGIMYYAENNDQITNPVGSVAKFDGLNWSALTTANSGIASEIVNDIVEHDAKFYFATDSGLSILDGANWTTINSSNANIPSNQLYRVFVSDEITILITSDGLSYKKTDSTGWVSLSNAEIGSIGSGRINYWAARPTYANGKIYTGVTTTKVISTESTEVHTHNFRSFGFALYHGRGVCITSDSGLMVIDSNAEKLTAREICSRVSFTNQLSEMPIQLSSSSFIFLSGLSGFSDYPKLKVITDGKIHRGLDMSSVWWPINSINLTLYDRKNGTMSNPLTGKKFNLNDYIIEVEKGPSHTGIIDINNFSSPVHNLGDMLGGIVTDVHETIPKDDCKSVGYAASLWISGKDKDSAIHLAAMTYRQRGQDFWPGPLNKTDGSFHAPDEEKYDRVWKVNKSEIQYHIALASKGPITESQTTEAIWNWPAHGANGASAQLAPYVDLNLNNQYEPELGEYPDVPGDQCIYWIMNDQAHTHGETQGLPLGVEIHGMAYAYKCASVNDARESINNTIFYKYRIVNRSEMDYHDVVMNHWNYVDIGYFGDDFVGCHVTQNFGFGYNGDDYDETSTGYGLNPPMASVLILDAPTKLDDGVDGDGDGQIDEADEKRMMGSFMGYNNDGNPINGNPSVASDYYNYSRSKWKTGDAIKLLDVPTKYMFPGDTDPDFSGFSWDEISVGNTPADRRFLLGTYPFTLDSKEEVNFEYARIYSRDESKYDQLPQMLDYVNDIKSWYYESGKPPCFHAVRIEDVKANAGALKLYPNPTSGSFTIEAIKSIESIEVLDVSGKILFVKQDVSQLSETIDLNILPVGVYFVRTITEEGVFNNKVIKR